MPPSYAMRHAHIICLLTLLIGACVSVPDDESPSNDENASSMQEPEQRPETTSTSDDPDAPLESTVQDHNCRRLSEDFDTWFSLDPESPELGEPVTVSFHAKELEQKLNEPSVRIVTPGGISELEVTRVETTTQTVWRGTFSPEIPDHYTLIFYDNQNSARYGECAFSLEEL